MNKIINKVVYGFLGAFLLAGATHSTPIHSEFKLELGAPIKSANLSAQCPRYKISNKPAIMPRFKCRFS